jgi:hypothetical protein
VARDGRHAASGALVHPCETDVCIGSSWPEVQDVLEGRLRFGEGSGLEQRLSETQVCPGVLVA